MTIAHPYGITPEQAMQTYYRECECCRDLWWEGYTNAGWAAYYRAQGKELFPEYDPKWDEELGLPPRGEERGNA